MLGVGLHQLGRLVAVVVLVGRAVRVPALGEHEDVLAEADRVRVDGDGLEVDIRVVAGGLARGRAVKVPCGQVLGLVILLGKGLWGVMVSCVSSCESAD